MRIFSILLFCITLFSTSSFGQKNVEISLNLITPEVLGQVNLEMEELVAWIQETNSTIEEHFSSSKSDFDVMVVVNFNTKGKTDIQLHYKPFKYAKENKEELLPKLIKIDAPKTKYSDYTMAIMAKVNEGSREKDEFQPEIVWPIDRKIEAFKNLSLKEQYEGIKRMAREEILPTIAHFETNVDEQFAGVLALGELISSPDVLDKSTEEITSNNPDYWRATLEMSQKNQLIPFTKAAVHLAKGELDEAKHLLRILNIFSDPKTLPMAFFDEIAQKLEAYNIGLTNAINKGIALHDAGKYDDAIAYYEGLQRTIGGSAWLSYELYLSNASNASVDSSNVIWDAHKAIIYDCDPMYNLFAAANSKDDGFEMWRRMELKEVFNERDKLVSDLVLFADIALDLKNYDIAGQVYWMIISHIPEEKYNNRNLLAHFLYCMDELGQKDVLTNFNEETLSQIEVVAKEREEFKKNHFGYKTMK